MEKDTVGRRLLTNFFTSMEEVWLLLRLSSGVEDSRTLQPVRLCLVSHLSWMSLEEVIPHLGLESLSTREGTNRKEPMRGGRYLMEISNKMYKYQWEDSIKLLETTIWKNPLKLCLYIRPLLFFSFPITTRFLCYFDQLYSFLM